MGLNSSALRGSMARPHVIPHKVLSLLNGLIIPVRQDKPVHNSSKILKSGKRDSAVKLPHREAVPAWEMQNPQVSF
jgi:hypothetical protein